MKTNEDVLYESLNALTDTYGIACKKNIRRLVVSNTEDFWCAKVFCNVFLVNGAIEVSASFFVKPKEFDVIQSKVLWPNKKKRITDSFRATGVFSARSYNIENRKFYFTCNEQQELLNADAAAHQIFDAFNNCITEFTNKADGSVLQYFITNKEQFPLEAGMALLTLNRYDESAECFDIADIENKKWNICFRDNRRFLHHVLRDYCNAMKKGIEWTESMIDDGLPKE